MYQNPTLFPQISDRESWIQTIQLFDDDTGELITLADADGNAAYSIVLEIMPPRRDGYSGYAGPSPWYDNNYSHAVIYERLGQSEAPLVEGNPIGIVGAGTISIQLPKSTVQRLRRHVTYDVFLTLNDDANDDGRQLLIGRLPVFHGGRGT